MFSTTSLIYLISLSLALFQVLCKHIIISEEDPGSPKWSLILSDNWHVLGPVSQHAREQYFLSPLYPFDLTIHWPVDFEKEYSSSLTDGATIRWCNITSSDGHIELSFSDIRWQELRASEGWAALQHHALLHSEITVFPPSQRDDEVAYLPLLVADVQQVSFFAIIPDNFQANYTPIWHSGNIYNLSNSPTHLIELPCPPSRSQPTKYHVFVSGDYEIRLFGDPLDMEGQETPIQRLGFKLSMVDPAPPIRLEPQLDVVPDFLDGWAFADNGTMGIGLKNSNEGWWEVTVVPELSSGNRIELAADVLRLAPYQSLILPVQIMQTGPYLEEFLTVKIIFKSYSEELPQSPGQRTLTLDANIPISHKRLWISGEDEIGYKASYTLGQMPLYFMVKPPQRKSRSSPAIIALHGAGVEASSAFWTGAIKRQPKSWIIFPTGRTSWGFDWHGPSTLDVWGSLEALRSILRTHDQWNDWSTEESKVILMGHSNGGQGVWYQAERFPDRVIAAVPAAAYIKSQSYISLTQSRGGHFMDASLRGILESTLQPDDNDIFLSNLVSLPLTVIHGGKDRNVPTWHSRELVGGLKTRYPQHSVMYHEVAGAPHWWDTVFTNDKVQTFLDDVVQSRVYTPPFPKNFVLTVAIPEESGSLHGFRIQKLEIPGRIGRIKVVADNHFIVLTTVNVLEYSFQVPTEWRDLQLVTDGIYVDIPQGETALLVSKQQERWKVVSSPSPARPSGPLHRILSSKEPLAIVVPEGSKAHLSAAVRVAHNLLSYLRIASVILHDNEASQELIERTSGCANYVIMGGKENSFGEELMASSPGPLTFVKGGWTLRGQLFNSTGLGLAFLYRHPACGMGLSLFMASTDEAGLERILRLFPLRTGVMAPEWIITGPEADTIGAGGILGAGFWGQNWEWSDAHSWMGFN